MNQNFHLPLPDKDEMNGEIYAFLFCPGGFLLFPKKEILQLSVSYADIIELDYSVIRD